MKHKHSPNFHTNLEEADKAKNSPVSAFFWTVVLITTLMLGFSVTKTKAQSDTLRPDKALSIFRDTSKVKGASRYLFGTVTDDGLNVQIRTDTIPVIMLVSDTTIERNNGLKDLGAFVFSLKECPSYTIYGYEVKEKVLSGDAVNTLRFQYYKTTYLNHLKQPLPDRIIVWMTIRRNDK